MTPNSGTRLLTAIRTGDVGELRKILADPGLDINALCNPTEHEPVSPLTAALHARNPEVLKIILQQPALDLRQSLPAFGTWSWARSTSVEMLRLFLSHPGTEINQQDADGKTLLHAAVAGDADNVNYLVNQGGDIDISQRDGTTPLYQAVLHGNEAAVDLLLKLGANINNRNNDNLWTILMVAVAAGRADLVEILLRHPEIDVNAQSDIGEAALHIAAERGDLVSVKLLLNHPAINLNLKNRAGWTALTKAAFWNRIPVLQTLLAQPGLEVNFVDRDRQTALHWAVLAGNTDAVQCLLHHPAINPAITNRPARQTAEDLAIALGFGQIADLLKNKSATGNSIDALSPNDSYEPRPIGETRPVPEEPAIGDPS